MDDDRVFDPVMIFFAEHIQRHMPVGDARFHFYGTDVSPLGQYEIYFEDMLVIFFFIEFVEVQLMA